MNCTIAIIDYGAGNLSSITNALDFIGRQGIGCKADYRVTDKPEDIRKAEKLIFPGVGSFGDCITSLKKKGLFGTLREEINQKPYLGICLGLQVLFESSEESPGIEGISLLKGRCKRFKGNMKFKGRLKIPQIGWNSIELANKKSPLLKGIKGNSYFYFVHSYYAAPRDREIILTKTDYGVKFASSIEKGNIFGVQFHPERSGETGIELLKNFVRL